MSSTGLSPRRKPVLRFAVQAAAIGVALGFLPGAKVFYPAAFNAHANLVFSWFGEGHSVRFKTLPWQERADHSDTRMVGLGPHGPKPQWRAVFRNWSRGWWPTAILTGMVLATPLAPRRRLLALVAGLIVLDALILLRVGALAFVLFGATEPASAAAHERWMEAVAVVTESFNSWVTPVACVLLTWAAVASPASTIDLRGPRRVTGARPDDRPPR